MTKVEKMTHVEFIEAHVEQANKSKDLEEIFVRAAATELIQKGKHEKRHISEGVLRAREIQDKYQPNLQEKSVKTIKAESSKSHVRETTPFLLLTANDLLQAIDLWVSEAREKIFGEPEIPFETSSEAFLWIHNEAQNLTTTKENDKKEGAHIYDEIKKQIQVLFDLTGIKYELVHEIPQLRFFLGGGKRTMGHVFPYGLVVKFGSKLHMLAKYAKHLAESTSFKEADLVDYLLIGKKPTLPRITYEYVPYGLLDQRKLVATFYAPDVTTRELHDLHRQMRILWPNVRSRRVSAADDLYMKLESEMGGFPESRKGRGKFWGKMINRYNEEALKLDLKTLNSTTGLMHRRRRLMLKE